MAVLIAAGCTTGGGSEQDAGPPGPPTVTVPGATYLASGTPLVLQAVAADPQGGTLAYHWEQTVGAPVTVSGANGPALTVNAPSVKVDLTFRVTVTNPGGQAAFADAKVLVRRNTPAEPLPLLNGRTFTYTLREEVYAWAGTPGPLHPAGPQAAGTATLVVTEATAINGIRLWDLAITESLAGTPPTCQAGQAADVACGSPNFACASNACVDNKALSSGARVMQVDNTLWLWVDEHTPALLIVDPARQVTGGVSVFDGYELFSGKTRVQPQLPDTPLKFLGDTTLVIPGSRPAGTVAAQDAAAATVEIFDGTRRTDVLTPYRATRTFYIRGQGVVFFQAESVPEGFLNAAQQSGYRDAVLTGIDPAP